MTDQPALSPLFLRDGEGDVLQFSPSERLIGKATAATTGGAFDQFELTADPDHEGSFEEASPLMHTANPDPAELEAVNEHHATRVVGPPLPSPTPPVV